MVASQEIHSDGSHLLEQPWKSEKLVQLRTGKIKTVFGPDIRTAIYKSAHNEPISVTKLIIGADEHAFELGGGPDRVLLQYCSQHYDRWKMELPASEDLFAPGGFGENLVARYANERNICIGDVIQIGNVLAQVTIPRQPCFKLNHRFQVKDMARRAQDSSRTGWFYRILEEGTIQTGDEMTLRERPNPDWTVARVQHHLYHDMRNEEAMKALVQIKELGAEIRNIFASRLRKQYENQAARIGGGDAMALTTWSDYNLVKRRAETPKIVSLTFAARDPIRAPELVQPGSHVRLRLGGKLVRAYSVVAGDTNQFELAVAHSARSRGGSRFIHTRLQQGDTLSVGKITSSFPLAVDAEKHVFIAGGIGLTAFIASAQRCQRDGSPYHLHHLVRTSSDIALRRYLDEFSSNVTVYDKSQGKLFHVEDVLKGAGSGAHIYCCGSDRLMVAVAESARCIGIDQERLHFEKFEISTSGDPFVAQLSESKKKIEVNAEQTLLDVLREAGLDIASSCEAGHCGTCRVGVKAGRIEHRGTGLMDDEKCSSMLSCVSRGVGEIILEL
ncbi:uncharacterized protein A1O9_10570 [Exophiala aquamarina CBS 119918]|uniref:MOSC domain-containing protein n=1 Tax=Exophiala aquamarina CBS 119918 TaxID=1182545 RepID=A0A072PDD6_9EURO|nr:uncharacterized protein A1O9_10570 [Exophiala aquamarina CBS 119918]KEF53595.1 hypothetical protein A1O9_10570 [Exophiala aquamarina CBS 119918]